MAMTDEVAKVRYSRRPSQGIIMGLDAGGVASVGVSGLIFYIVLQAADLLGALLTLPFLIPVVIGGVWKWHGTAINTHLVRTMIFNIRKGLGMTKYRRKPVVHELGVLDLPGMQSRLHMWETAGGDSVVWDAAKGTASISCVVATPGMGGQGRSILSAEEQDRLTAGWMVVCGAWTRRQQIARVMLSERTRPGTTVREQRAFDAIDTDGKEDIAASYQEALNLAAPHVVMRPTVITITLSTGSGVGRELVKSHGGGKAGVLAMAEQEIAATTESLSSAGFTRIQWWTPRGWAAWGRGIVDPIAEPAVDSRIGTAFEGVAPEIAGPMSLEERKNEVETDSAFHRAYWVMEFPRLETRPGFMEKIVFAESHQGWPVRHTLSLVGTPVPLKKALGRVEDERRKWASNSKIRQRRGEGDSMADRADWQNLDHHEAELISGQGELKFTAYLVVSGLSMEALDSACASMEIAAANAGIEVLKLTHQQAAGLMTVAYPTGVGMR